MPQGNKPIGRPIQCPDQEVALKHRTLRVSFKQERLAEKFGLGNFGEGVRLALERAAADIRFMDEVNEKAKRKRELK